MHKMRWDQVEEWLRELLVAKAQDSEEPYKPAGAEIGVKEGKFTEHMLKTFPTLSMICVDPWEAQPDTKGEGGETYEEWDFNAIYDEALNRFDPYANRVGIFRAYSTDEIVLRAIKDESLDFVFIDAMHTEEAVKEDIALWWPKVKPGGFISGHDWQHKFPGVERAVRSHFSEFDIVLGANSTWMVWKR